MLEINGVMLEINGLLNHLGEIAFSMTGSLQAQRKVKSVLNLKYLSILTWTTQQKKTKKVSRKFTY